MIVENVQLFNKKFYKINEMCNFACYNLQFIYGKSCVGFLTNFLKKASKKIQKLSTG